MASPKSYVKSKAKMLKSIPENLDFSELLANAYKPEKEKILQDKNATQAWAHEFEGLGLRKLKGGSESLQKAS